LEQSDNDCNKLVAELPFRPFSAPQVGSLHFVEDPAVVNLLIGQRADVPDPAQGAGCSQLEEESLEHVSFLRIVLSFDYAPVPSKVVFAFIKIDHSEFVCKAHREDSHHDLTQKNVALKSFFEVFLENLWKP